MPKLAVRGVTVCFRSGGERIRVLDDLTTCFEAGRFNVVAGPSGSGKTTLLSVLGALIRPDEGFLELDAKKLESLDRHAVEAYRRRDVGYVYQAFRLMRSLSAFDNIRLSTEVRRINDGHKLASDALGRVGMSAKAALTPNQMSGGEQQRVAIARAIAHCPRILLADEPTANLDSGNGASVISLLAELARDDSRVVVAVSHDHRLIDRGDHVIRLEDGRILRTHS